MSNSDSQSSDSQRGSETRSTSRDRAAEDLLAECLALSEDEWTRAVRETCRKRPDLADPLEQLLRNVRAIDRVLEPPETTASDAEGIPVPSTLGDFEVLERVGGGGMGFVYRARQISLQRTVALKLIRPEHLFFAKAKERFRREAEAISRLHHPGIVPLYEVGEERGLPFFAMEFIEGQSLSRILTGLRFRNPAELRAQDFARAYRQGARDPDRVPDEGVFSAMDKRRWPWLCCRVVARVAQALDHAHANGVIHRDIKPSNVMVTDAGRVVIVDFGLAIAEGAQTLTRTGSNPGSLPYMSPEQIAGEPVDHRTDIYSLGVTLYELLTLRCPFPLSNPESARKHIASGSFERPRSRNSSVSPEIEAVCLKAMDLDRDGRYATAAEFADDLLNAVTHRPIRARTFSWPRRLGQLILRHPARSLATSALFLLCVAAPLVFGIQQYRHVAQLRTEQDATSTAVARANLSEKEAASVAEFLRNMIEGADPYRAKRGDLTIREAVIASASKVESSFQNTPLIQSRMMGVMAGVLNNIGLRSEAHALATRGLELVRARLGNDSERLIPLLRTLSDTELDGGTAERFASEAVGIAERHPEIGLIQMAVTYGVLADTKYLSGRLWDAEEAIRKCIVRVEAGLREIPKDDSDMPRVTQLLASALSRLAEILRMRGDTGRAKEIALEALARLKDAVGSGHPVCFSLFLTLSDIELEMSDGPAAEKWALEAVHLASSTLGQNPAGVKRAELVLAKVLAVTGRAREVVLDQVDAAIATIHDKCGGSSSDYGMALAVRAHVLAGRSQPQEAEAAATDALSIGFPGLEVPMLILRTRVRMQLGRIGDALSDAQRVVDLSGGATAKKQAEALFLLSSCEGASGRLAEAETTLERAALVLRVARYESSAELVVVDQARSAVKWRLGKFDEATQLALEAISKMSADDPLLSLRRATALIDLGCLHYCRGDLTKATGVWQQALEIHEDMLGHDSPLVGEDRLRLAVMMFEGGDVEEAKELGLAAESRNVPPTPSARAVRGYWQALMEAHQGRPEEGLRTLHRTVQGLTEFKVGGAPFDVGTLCLRAAQMATKYGNHDLAEDLANTALMAFNKNPTTPKWLRADAQILLARCLMRAEALPQAAALLAEVESSIPTKRNDAWERISATLCGAKREGGEYGIPQPLRGSAESRRN